ncbi:MAG: hypothetical protein AB7E66_08155 [Parvibaculaceae bacterium]
MEESYDRFEGFFEAEVALLDADHPFTLPVRARDRPKPGSSAAIAEALVRLRQLALRRATRLHRHATGLPVPPMPPKSLS